MRIVRNNGNAADTSPSFLCPSSYQVCIISPSLLEHLRHHLGLRYFIHENPYASVTFPLLKHRRHLFTISPSINFLALRYLFVTTLSLIIYLRYLAVEANVILSLLAQRHQGSQTSFASCHFSVNTLFNSAITHASSLSLLHCRQRHSITSRRPGYRN